MTRLSFSKLLFATVLLSACTLSLDVEWNDLNSLYGNFTTEQRVKTLNSIRETFYFGYDNYMKYAYPKDELDPIHCRGRGPDAQNP